VEQHRGTEHNCQHNSRQHENPETKLHMQQKCDHIHEQHLAQAARGRGYRSSQHQSAARRGTHQKLLHDSQITLPDQRNPIENCAKQNALREDSGRHEIQIADPAGGGWRACD